MRTSRLTSQLGPATIAIVGLVFITVGAAVKTGFIRIGRGASADSTLTATERKIIAAVTKHKGSPNKTIAAALHISSHTLRNHLASIYEKLGVHKRVDLVFYALENGLDIDSPPRPFRNSTRLEQR